MSIYIKNIFLLLITFGICQIGWSQESTYQMKPNSKEIEANFLSSYYQQDGNNGAVTGGIGTEELTDFANTFTVNVPLDSINSVSLYMGADFYTSASTDAINNNKSSASSQDLRGFGTLSYNRKNLKRGETYGIRAGFSAEYDYTSVSGGLSYTKEWNEGNSEISGIGQVFIDRWVTYFPKELRNRVSVPTKDRQSYNAQLIYSQVINQRLQASISGEMIYMNGLLSTPFHRVYFSDNNQHDIERLPDTRLKIPLGIRLNYFPTDQLVIRSNYRFYTDDWGINAHSFNLETPIKVNQALTVTPFYRFHTQSAADYFAPYEVHSANAAFYTSDYDLSELSSHKVGMNVKISPVYGVLRKKSWFKNKEIFMLKYVELRGAYYTRSTDLNASIFSINLGFSFK